MNIKMKFSVWISLCEEDPRYKHLQETVSQTTTVIHDGWSRLRLPYLILQPCTSYEQYVDIWTKEVKPKIDLWKLGLKEENQLLDLLPQCYGAYKTAKETDIIEPVPKNYGANLSNEDTAYRRSEMNRVSHRIAYLFPTLLCRIYIDDVMYDVPYVVRGHCDDFEEYWSRWILQCGPTFDLKENNVYSGDRLERIVKRCYNEFCSMLRSIDPRDILVSDLSMNTVHE